MMRWPTFTFWTNGRRVQHSGWRAALAWSSFGVIASVVVFLGLLVWGLIDAAASALWNWMF